MKKEDIITKLTAAGIEIPAGATVAILTDLAKEKNVDLTEATTDEPPAAFVPTEEAIAEKVRAGLRREQAIEVLTNQAAHDAEPAK